MLDNGRHLAGVANDYQLAVGVEYKGSHTGFWEVHLGGLIQDEQMA
jgi:hypothetical protein